MATVQCKVEIPEVPELTSQELTVGREFLLVCEGEFPKTLKQEELKFILQPAEKYQIHLLSFEFRSPNQADLKVTSYKAGQFQFQNLQITDGTETLELGPIQYAVQSVLPQGEQGQPPPKQEPYGPIGPASVSTPLLYWAILAGIVALLLGAVFSRIYRMVQRKNMLARLKEHDAAMSPISQFHQSMRKLQRSNTVFFGGAASAEDIKACVKETEQMLRLFLTRQYQLPAFEWSQRLILKDLKKHHPAVFAEFGNILAKLMKEYSRAQEDQENLTTQDALNIATATRKMIEGMEKLS